MSIMVDQNSLKAWHKPCLWLQVSLFYFILLPGDQRKDKINIDKLTVFFPTLGECNKILVVLIFSCDVYYYLDLF